MRLWLVLIVLILAIASFDLRLYWRLTQEPEIESSAILPIRSADPPFAWPSPAASGPGGCPTFIYVDEKGREHPVYSGPRSWPVRTVDSHAPLPPELCPQGQP